MSGVILSEDSLGHPGDGMMRLGRGAETRGNIINEARRLFAEKGFDGVTTLEIARAASVAEGSIYTHFASKKELFLACVEPAVLEAVKRTREALNGASDAAEAVRAAIASRVEVFEEHSDSFRILFAGASHHPELAEMLYEQVYRIRSEEAAGARDRLFGGGLSEIDHLILGLGLTAAIWAMLQFIDVQRRAGDTAGAAAAVAKSRLIEELAEFVLYGMMRKKAGGAVSCGNLGG